MRAVLAVDIGSSSAKALLLSETQEVVAEASSSYPSFSPKPGWLEQRPEDWWQAFKLAARACVAQACGIEIAAIGVSGHMSVMLALDSQGKPLRPAITIADTRCTRETTWLNESFADILAAATGNRALTAFTLPKLLWFKEHEKELFRQTKVLLTVKDFINWKLTGIFCTEPTDAGNTLLLDYQTRQWNSDFIERLGLPHYLMPPLNESLSVVGGLGKGVAKELGFRAGTPVVAGLADMASSTLGMGLLDSARLAITLGTAAQVTQVVDRPSPALLGKFSYHPHALAGKLYLMASLFTGGLALHWFAELLSSFTGETLEHSIDSMLRMAEKSVPGSNGIVFLPFLSGRGSPLFDPSLTASLLGLRRTQSGADLARALLEGVAFSIRHCLDVMQAQHTPPEAVVLGGGGSRSILWQEIIADSISRQVGLLQTSSAGPLGTALATGKTIQLFELTQTKIQTRIQPVAERAVLYEQSYQQYLKWSKSNEFS